MPVMVSAACNCITNQPSVYVPPAVPCDLGCLRKSICLPPVVQTNLMHVVLSVWVIGVGLLCKVVQKA